MTTALQTQDKATAGTAVGIPVGRGVRARWGDLQAAIEAQILAHGPMTAAALARKLDRTRYTVHSIVYRMTAAGRLQVVGVEGRAPVYGLKLAAQKCAVSWMGVLASHNVNYTP